METFANDESTNDFFLDSDGNLAVDVDLNAVLSVCKNAVQTRRFELQYDANKGVPYFDTVFKDSATVELWASYVQNAILNVSGVNSVRYFDLSFEGKEGILKYEAGIRTIYGTDNITGASKNGDFQSR